MIFRRALLVILLFACIPGSPRADCGSSGNTLWNFAAIVPATGFTVWKDRVLVSAGSRLSILSLSTGAEMNFRDFSGVTLTRPLASRLKGGGADEVFVGGSNGSIQGLNPSSLATIWNRSLLRATCTSDAIVAAPAIQTHDDSDPVFQAAHGDDIVMAGTDPACSSTAAARVYGLDASNSSIDWAFNLTGSSQMDAVQAITVDRVRNTAYVTTGDGGAPLQRSIWALNSTSGALRWGRALGAISAEAVLAGGRLYVGTSGGELYALDPATGATLWQTTVSATFAITRLAANAVSGALVVHALDSGGTLHAYSDLCTGFGPLWNFKPLGAKVTSAPGYLGAFLYVGADDGKVWQIRAADGVANAWATVSGIGSAPSNDPIVVYESFTPYLIASSGGTIKKLCIPWPDTVGDKALLVPREDNRAVAPARRLFREGVVIHEVS